MEHSVLANLKCENPNTLIKNLRVFKVNPGAHAAARPRSVETQITIVGRERAISSENGQRECSLVERRKVDNDGTDRRNQ